MTGGTSGVIDFDDNGGFGNFNHGGGWNDATNRFTPPVRGVYQMNTTIMYRLATPGTVLQFFLRTASPDLAKYKTVDLPSDSGTVNLSSTWLSDGNGAGPIWVEFFTSGDICFERFGSTFSGHLVYPT